MSGQTNKSSQTQTAVWWLPEGRGVEEVEGDEGDEGVRHVVTEGDLTLSNEHTVQRTDDVLELYTSESYHLRNQCHLNEFNKIMPCQIL